MRDVSRPMGRRGRQLVQWIVPRYRAVARRLAIVPLRTRGILLAGVGLWVTFAIGRDQSDYLLYPAGICAVALVALSALCVMAGTLRLWLGVRGKASGIAAGL